MFADKLAREPSSFSDAQKVEVARICLHHLRRLLFARKLDAFYVSVVEEPPLQTVEPAFWGRDEADRALFFGKYETAFEGASTIFFREGAIEAALSDDGSQADKPASAGRPSIQPAVRAAYWRLYPQGHGVRGHAWKTFAAEIGSDIGQAVSEDTVQRAVRGT